jgi:hypothetical protein
VLRAEAGATIGIGLRETVGREELRQAAAEGTIGDLVDWHHVAAGDSFYSPAGTVHSIGPGLALIEVQQNIDVTYRLYDHGRDREIQLDEGVAAASPAPYRQPLVPYVLTPGREILADGPAFVLERWRAAGSGMLQAKAGRPVWLIGVADGGRIDGQPITAGTAWLAESAVELELEPPPISSSPIPARAAELRHLCLGPGQPRRLPPPPLPRRAQGPEKGELNLHPRSSRAAVELVETAWRETHGLGFSNRASVQKRRAVSSGSAVTG